jgi:hypothetical protein
MDRILIQGGLGNQLFLLLQAIRIQDSTKKNIQLDVSEYNKRQNRTFVLKKISKSIENNFQFSMKDEKIYFVSKLIQRVYSIINKDSLLNKVIKFHLPLIGNVYFGYGQHISTKEDFKALDKLRALINIKKASIPAIALHLRRGDYLLSQHNIHGIVSLKDALKEAQYLQKKLHYSKLVIFTDSPELFNIKDMKIKNLHISIDSSTDPVFTFKRIARYKAIITSNSSFSLMAALLGNADFISIPSLWLKNISSDMLGLHHLRRYKCTL